MKRLMISFDKQQLSWLAEESTRLGLTKSLLVKKALDWYIAMNLPGDAQDEPKLTPEEISYGNVPSMQKYLPGRHVDIPLKHEDIKSSGSTESDIPF